MTKLLLDCAGVRADDVLIIAVKHGNAKIVALLLKQGAQALDEALIVAVKNEDLEIVQILLESGADPTIRSDGIELHDLTDHDQILFLLHIAISVRSLQSK